MRLLIHKIRNILCLVHKFRASPKAEGNSIESSHIHWNRYELGHQKCYQIGRHFQRCFILIPNVTRKSRSTKVYMILIRNIIEGKKCVKMIHYMSTVFRIRILLAVFIVVLRPKVMENWAFMLGSSKQGKARRASGASICVTAKYLSSYIILYI